MRSDQGQADLGKIIEHYQQLVHLPQVVLPKKSTTTSNPAVLLTGVTGGLGCHLLANLLSDPNIQRVFCLVRARDPRTVLAQLSQSLIKNGYDQHILETHAERLVVIPCDLRQPRLGIDGLSQKEIENSITHIIHAAWTVNFNLPLDTFLEHDIRGLCNLLNYAFAIPTLQQFTFVSSIGAIQSFPENKVVPEARVDDFTSVPSNGYGQSKFISEHIVSFAASELALPTSVVRLGQLSGSSATGYWNPKELIPGLIRSSLTVGAVPDHFSNHYWLPIDLASVILNKIALYSRDKQPHQNPKWFHVCNPVPTAWNSVTRAFNLLPSRTRAIQAVPMERWLQLVTQSAAVCPFEDVPSIKLLGFLEAYTTQAMPTLGVANVLEVDDRVHFGDLPQELLIRYVTRASIIE